MSISAILILIWTFLNSPWGITISASIAAWLLSKIYTVKPLWEEYEGAIITAVKFAENWIDDDTENRSLAKLDYALQYVLKVYTTMEGKTPTDKVKAELTTGIGIIHNKLEKEGTLH